ncbi:DNA-binding CsgD family transcriptional regulator [Lysobacter enzymogenes]|uniref:helix-turn-helix transcriptional regulator n=1 Tax=Lysobacter enzymogenes TaxID=69 RepID=UPI0033973BF7
MRSHDLDAPLDPELGASLLAAAGNAAFGALLLGAARRFDAVDEVFSYRADAGAAPVALLSCSDRDGAGERAEGYARGYYRIDPLNRDGGESRGFVRVVRAAQIPAGDYRETCFGRPAFADKVCFGWQRGGQRLVLNFYRGPRARGQPARALATLGSLAMAALSAQAASAAPAMAPADPVARLEARLRRSYPTLSARERQIVARSLSGRSAQQIGAELGIGGASVLTYRQRAYRRFGYAGAQDFLAALLD